MHNVRQVTPDIFWVGGNDRRLERFENMFPVPNGVSYNSYVIIDEKTALIDTVDSSISELFLENVTHALAGRSLDYLVLNHMEPDHCANIENVIRRYPEVKVIGNKKTFQFFEQYYTMDISTNRLEVAEGEQLSLGKHTLSFYTAPMVHWPEVMVTYEALTGMLFSADAFGSFGAVSGNLFDDEIDYEKDYLDEMRRYYANIVGRYGAQVQATLKKLSKLDIKMIAPLHGPIWRKNISYLLDKYNKWSSYIPEEKGIVLFYASMYGNTENVINVLASKLADRGIKNMHMYDVSKTHASYIISDVWKYSHMVAASPTYNMHLYFMMDSLLKDMEVLGVKNRKVSLIGNHSWASAALNSMKEQFCAMKNIDIVGTPLDIRSTLKPDQEKDLDALADAICASLKE